MKRIIYGVMFLYCLFLGITNVNALGSVKVDTQVIEVEQGKSAVFKIIVDNALARGNISSGNKKIITIKEEGIWVSEGAGKNKTIEHEITVKATGKTGTTNVLIDLFDASTYDGESIATRANPIKYMITVNVLPKEGSMMTTIIIVVCSLLAFGGITFWFVKKNKRK